MNKARKNWNKTSEIERKKGMGKRMKGERDKTMDHRGFKKGKKEK
jgi:hypothetical protein